MPFLFILPSPWLFIIWFGLAITAGIYGHDRRLGFWGNLALAILLSPVLVLLVLLVTDESERKRIKREQELEAK